MNVKPVKVVRNLIPEVLRFGDTVFAPILPIGVDKHILYTVALDL
jgi:hypothetical protein